MLRNLGIAVFQLLSMFAFTAGIISLINAGSIPGQYSLYSASAAQLTQVYSEAMYSALMAVGYLLAAIFIQIALYFGYPRRNTQLLHLQHEVGDLKELVRRIGGIIQKSRVP